ncbi:MAG: glutathione S-transferase family protein, partial [Nannocystaceae bacterium]
MESAVRPTIYGWPSSPYTEKVVRYVRFHERSHQLVAPTAWQLRRKITRAVGRAIMPTMEISTGRWIQDSSEIIDYFASQLPHEQAFPCSPTQRLVSALVEYYADEWMPIIIMHTRWNTPENRNFAEAEFAATGMPWVPAGIARRLVRPISQKMASYRAVLGVTEESIPGVERRIQALLTQLETHLAASPFLLGEAPCVGDFALCGPLYAHIYRDPGSRHRFDGLDHLRQWMDRLTRPPEHRTYFSESGEVPATLEPVLEGIFAEQWPFARQVVQAIETFAEGSPGAPLPRGLGWAPCIIGGSESRRKIATESQWKIQ